MKRLLSCIGLCAAPRYRIERELEEVETMARLDYLDWMAYRWPDGILWITEGADSDH